MDSVPITTASRKIPISELKALTVSYLELLAAFCTKSNIPHIRPVHLAKSYLIDTKIHDGRVFENKNETNPEVINTKQYGWPINEPAKSI